MKRGLFIFIGLVLVAAVAVQWSMGAKLTTPGKGRHLRAVMPFELVGWNGRDVPLGATEVRRGQVEKILQFDEAYFREFTSIKGIVSLYVAYWGPGKMPVQVVASHTPDRCWVENGWTCEAVKHRYRFAADGPGLRAGEWRIFAAPDQQRHYVQFWHLVGSETYDYGLRLNSVPSVWRWWRDAVHYALKGSSEQYFVRIMSSQPLEDLQSDPGFQEILSALARLGLGSASSTKG